MEEPKQESRKRGFPLRLGSLRPSRVLLAKCALAMGVFLVSGEMLTRAYWRITKQTPLLAAHVGIESYYPMVRASDALTETVTSTDGRYDVLILGGSTPSDAFGSIGSRLQAGLERQLGRPVRVYNLAQYAHNSRDSAVKHRFLADQRFDLVVLYDGINDARMNCTPPERFRADYSHCRWYDTLGSVERHVAFDWSALLFSAKFVLDRFREATGLTWYVPRHRPGPELSAYGREVRTEESFRANYADIVTAAAERGERVVLMTFACHVPANYTEEDCVAGRLDYGDQWPEPVELWGQPNYVMAAVDRHNTVIRDLASSRSGIIFVDQDRLLPHTGKVFRDCCHLTDDGCALFVANILAALDERP